MAAFCESWADDEHQYTIEELLSMPADITSKTNTPMSTTKTDDKKDEKRNDRKTARLNLKTPERVWRHLLTKLQKKNKPVSTEPTGEDEEAFVCIPQSHSFHFY